MPRGGIARCQENPQDVRMSHFLERFEHVVRQRRLLVHGQRVLVAVSGGVDSMVLLQALHLLAKQNEWTLAVAHFNHRLRGRASEADEKMVRQAAAALRLRFFGNSADVRTIAERSKLSIEMASRKLRHEFLAETARAEKIPTIALAHHADDQVELFFVRLLRGTSGEGLAGMKWLSPSPADKSVTLIRPLLGFSKSELLAFAHEKKFVYRTDASNFSADFLRNQIRNDLLLLLRENYQPALDKAVLRLMDIVGAEADFVSEAARRFCAAAAPGGAEGGQSATANGTSPGQLPAASFDELALAVQRKALQQQLAAFGLVPDFELIERLRAEPLKEVTVAPGMSVARSASGRVTCREHFSDEFNPALAEVSLSAKQGRGEFNGLKFRWSIEPMKRFKVPAKKPGEGSALRESFDADKVGGGIQLRHWRAGDRFQPIGLPSPAKLQDLFVNAKVPAAQRRHLIVATTQAGEIFWVEGLRIGEQFKLTPETARRLVWQPRRVLPAGLR